jgi:hypothetical protein
VTNVVVLRTRTRWIPLFAVVLVVGAVLFGSIASVAARDSGRTLRVLFEATSYKSTQADPNGNEFAPGDEVFLGGIIKRFARPHDQIGTVGLHCAATGALGSELLCDVAFTLPKGKISLQTLFDVQSEWLQPTRKLAITGGTGAYRSAGGEVTVTSLASGDESITFKFDD